MNEPLSVLLIGKGPGDLEGMLHECGRTIRLLHCRHPESGLDRVSEGGIDVVLLDLAGGQGVAIVDHLRRTA
ncbi:MAG: hypothetical protein WBH94_01935, partial [Methanoculleus sp.]